MASVDKVTTAEGQIRFRVRCRAGGRAVEKWAKTKSAAIASLLIDPRAGAQPLSDYAEQWLATRIVKGRPLADSTMTSYRGLLMRNILPVLGAVSLRSLKKEQVRAWYGQVAADASRDQAAKSYRLLHAMLTTAVADDLIRINPCGVRRGGQEHAGERPMIPTALVLELADTIDARYRALVLLAGFASLRTGESLGLRRMDVDLLHAEVHVRVQASRSPAKAGSSKSPSPRRASAVWFSPPR
jgi:hypothetical protein